MEPQQTDNLRKLRHVRANSWALTIPSAVVRELGWDNDTFVVVSASGDGRLIATPATPMRGFAPTVRKRDGATEAGMLRTQDAVPEPREAPAPVAREPSTPPPAPASHGHYYTGGAPAGGAGAREPAAPVAPPPEGEAGPERAPASPPLASQPASQPAPAPMAAPEAPPPEASPPTPTEHGRAAAQTEPYHSAHTREPSSLGRARGPPRASTESHPPGPGHDGGSGLKPGHDAPVARGGRPRRADDIGVGAPEARTTARPEGSQSQREPEPEGAGPGAARQGGARQEPAVPPAEPPGHARAVRAVRTVRGSRLLPSDHSSVHPASPPPTARAHTTTGDGLPAERALPSHPPPTASPQSPHEGREPARPDVHDMRARTRETPPHDAEPHTGTRADARLEDGAGHIHGQGQGQGQGREHPHHDNDDDDDDNYHPYHHNND